MKTKIHFQPIIFIIIGLLIFSTNIEAKSFQNIEPINRESTGFFKSIKGKWTKKIEKIFSKSRQKTTDEKIKKIGLLAFIVGVSSLLLLIVATIYLAPILFVFAGLAAIAGDILSIITLRRIKKSDDPRQHHLVKKLAISGLIFSLLTGVIPLVLLGLVLISL